MRSDLNDYKRMVREGKTRRELMEDCSEVLARYPRFCDEYLKMFLEESVTRQEFIPRDWQIELNAELCGPADNRKIIWYCDIAGNRGKSFFASNFSGNAYVVNGGKAADIYYAYFYEPVVFFDLARQKEDIVAYDVMENFKNGYFLSTKYQVKRVKFNIPHVVVFANFMPDQSKLSADRWDIRVI